MVAATKNTRGRPRSWRREEAEEFIAGYSENSARHYVNTQFANEGEYCLEGDNAGASNTFFRNACGGWKHKGIAEQLGRLQDSGLVTDEECAEIAHKVEAAYNAGKSSKEIESELRRLRLATKAARRGRLQNLKAFV